MKTIIKTILLCGVTVAAICLSTVSASAATVVSAEIPTEIEGGGTALITPDVNCPLPKETEIKIPNGMTEKINIDFTEPGNYTYTIHTADKNGIYYDPEYFKAIVAVRSDNDGDLTAVTVIEKPNSAHKPVVCKFTSTTEKPDDSSKPDDPENPDNPDSPGEPDTPTTPKKNAPGSKPDTGDDSGLDIYLAICIAASAGLFFLSVAYLRDTNQMIKQ